MTVSRLHGRPRDAEAFGPAHPSRLTLALLVALRCYALAAIAVVVYSFIRALH